MRSVAVAVLGGCLLAGLVLSCSMAPPPGSPETGYTITGYVGHSGVAPAINESLLLLDGETSKPVDSAQTNWLGKYAFSALQPGLYVVEVGSIQKKVFIKDESVRLDIDLSSKDGTMDYSKAAAAAPGKTGGAGSGGAAGAAGGGSSDASLMQAMAAQYWGYSGSTESKLALCADGTFNDYSESGYSGRSFDSGGNETMAWGTANESSGKGTWAIQGDTNSGTITLYYSGGNQRSVEYKPGDDRGCYYFGGRQMCRTGESGCQ